MPLEDEEGEEDGGTTAVATFWREEGPKGVRLPSNAACIN
jgi:hypothetical protein